MSASAAFTWPVRVYYEDTDAGDVVYHAGYVRFYERCRTEWLRALGWSQHALMTGEAPIAFAVRSMTIEWLKPARLDDLLHVELRVLAARRASIRFEQRILRAADGTVLSTAAVRVACVQVPDFKPTPIPDVLLETLSA